MLKIFSRRITFIVIQALFLILFNIMICNSQENQSNSETQKIINLENQIYKEPDKFSFDAHNELRHLYSSRNEHKAFYHCDEIFKHSPMNNYILSILSGWQLDKDFKSAIISLENNRKKYPVFQFVNAACLIKEGELYLKLGNKNAASLILEHVQKLPDNQLETYKTIAKAMAANIGRKPLPEPWQIPVLEIRYFPVTPDGQKIDIAVTSNVSASLSEIRQKCDNLTQKIITSLEEGSRFRAYKNSAAASSLKYKIIDKLEFLEPLPHSRYKKFPDYKKILERVNIKDYVENKGVKEVWIWGYHSPELAPWESNMASPYGDISNSDRDPADLPILGSTYTVYHYNYERTASEAVENHMHQIETLIINFNKDLWERFAGVPGNWRCGNCHYPPNGKHDYDWSNKSYVETDIEDWRPESIGEKISINCDKWQGDSLKWFIYWMQSLPGAGNNLPYLGKKLTNWWVVIGDYDGMIQMPNALFE